MFGSGGALLIRSGGLRGRASQGSHCIFHIFLECFVLFIVSFNARVLFAKKNTSLSLCLCLCLYSVLVAIFAYVTYILCFISINLMFDSLKNSLHFILLRTLDLAKVDCFQF
jgi:hypothetical protein